MNDVATRYQEPYWRLVTGNFISIPALLWVRMKIGPALASSGFATTATDVAGFLPFLGLGAAFLARFQ